MNQYTYIYTYMYIHIYKAVLDCMYADLSDFCEANILGGQRCVLDPLGPGPLGRRGPHRGPVH